MLSAYVYYPNPKITVHHDSSCADIQKMGKSGQRLVRIGLNSITAELQRFSLKQHAFAANRAGNDMWIEIDFSDPDFEAAVLAYIHRLIGAHYSPLASVMIATHC